MPSSNVFLSFFVLVAVIFYANALQCYSCHQFLNPPCPAVIFDNVSITIKTCPSSEKYCAYSRFKRDCTSICANNLGNVCCIKDLCNGNASEIVAFIPTPSPTPGNTTTEIPTTLPLTPTPNIVTGNATKQPPDFRCYDCTSARQTASCDNPTTAMTTPNVTCSAESYCSHIYHDTQGVVTNERACVAECTEKANICTGDGICSGTNCCQSDFCNGRVGGAAVNTAGTLVIGFFLFASFFSH
eukprot:m.309804 g.309804  ORF g.309804 m.309804 type:complete len:242 (+) comp47900_c0_seq1:38-763(+)